MAFFPMSLPQAFRDTLAFEALPDDTSISFMNSTGTRYPVTNREALTVGSYTPEVGRALIIDSLTVSASGPCRVSVVVIKGASQWSITGDDVVGGNKAQYWEHTFGREGGSTQCLQGYYLSHDTLRVIVYALEGYYPTVTASPNAYIVTDDPFYEKLNTLTILADSIPWSLTGVYAQYEFPNQAFSAVTNPEFFAKNNMWPFRLINALRGRAQRNSWRLINKGFGGSNILSKWYPTILNGYLDGFKTSAYMVSVGANDCRLAWTQERIDASALRYCEVIRHRNLYNRNAPIFFLAPCLLDDEAFWTAVSSTSTCRNTVDKIAAQTTYPFAGGATYEDSLGRTRMKILRDLMEDVADGTFDPALMRSNGQYDPTLANLDRTKVYFIDQANAERPEFNFLNQTFPDSNYGGRVPTFSGNVLTNGLKDTTVNFTTGVVTYTGSAAIGDDIDDKIFRGTGDPLNTERRRGYRVHRSPTGHSNIATLILSQNTSAGGGNFLARIDGTSEL